MGLSFNELLDGMRIQTNLTDVPVYIQIGEDRVELDSVIIYYGNDEKPSEVVLRHND
jgi:hypothetical protein